MVHDAEAAVVGQLVRELAEPGMPDGLVREHVLEHARALAALFRRPQDGARDVRPPAHHPEAVAHGEERGVRRLADAVEEGEQGPFPGRVLTDALRALGRAVVAMRIDVARPARPHVEGEPPARPVTSLEVAWA